MRAPSKRSKRFVRDNEIFTCLEWFWRWHFVLYIIEDRDYSINIGITQQGLTRCKTNQPSNKSIFTKVGYFGSKTTILKYSMGILLTTIIAPFQQEVNKRFTILTFSPNRKKVLLTLLPYGFEFKKIRLLPKVLKDQKRFLLHPILIAPFWSYKNWMQ